CARLGHNNNFWYFDIW
nr:immunoglobulin heavy chain junction region [Macaca mulatta]MOW45767.1 immunoglobulin heavy chain junction region [Macaca mulatta]MOW45911.1 immunoglobulin heavy chain junction region [Macaca mulatta]MOW46089.1 immunoglobulin heavy chain junction region [Macaca mulatta]MOW46296.1 immunoglobulin heavy chain junction region [Macaca mulatta]